MRIWLHIPLALACAAPAMALTPLPPCAGQMIEARYEIWESYAEENGFVSYYGKQQNSDQMLLVLEHCKTGRALLAQAIWNEGREGPNHLDDVQGAMESYLESDRSYTLGAIARGLRGKGIKVSRKTYAAESCACHVYHSDQRGDRREFAF